MTREKFAIHYEGKVGDFVGSVFGYQKGQRLFTPQSHPHLFKPGTAVPSRDRLVVPDGWKVVAGADTGTYYTAAWAVVAPNGDTFFVDELPNYRYVGGQPERNEEITIPEWATDFKAVTSLLRASNTAWADKNTQFKQELHNYGISLLGNSVPSETKTEIAREYFQHNKVWFAPWLEVLPHELENAEWPEEVSASGQYKRLKKDDHTLDCLEHILSKRPLSRTHDKKKARTWLEGFVGGPVRRRAGGNTHLGAQ